MSNIATAVVFHPNVNRSLKLWSTTVGRDKVRGNFLLPSVLPGTQTVSQVVLFFPALTTERAYI